MPSPARATSSGGDPRAELRKAAGPQADREYRRLMEAATAYDAERYKDARRIIEPLARRYPSALSIRELYGLTLYRQGEYAKAIKELTTFTDRTSSTEQHPVLMDCYRALANWDDVARLWTELRDASPSGELVTEGRIVMAGALADQGRLREALQLLQKGPVEPKRAKPHHLRLWYALADLEERSGNVPRARALFEQVRRRDGAFADVAERLAALG
ncbi:MAG TPA: tetratricopeptide repeat protein [Acidimicrobiia bacterium]|nr:tetratricopeptide repeat protein [Acidimicrobiia bacterium]